MRLIQGWEYTPEVWAFGIQLTWGREEIALSLAIGPWSGDIGIRWYR